MILAVDVQYDEGHDAAQVAGVAFATWLDAEPTDERVVRVQGVEPYVPGEFFRRELPCLLALLGALEHPPELIVVDGYVDLGERPGLGRHLFEALDGAIPVVGVAKTRFHDAPAVEVLRGTSRTPLLVTAAGMSPEAAAEGVAAMHGAHRIPGLLKRVDQLARGLL